MVAVIQPPFGEPAEFSAESVDLDASNEKPTGLVADFDDGMARTLNDVNAEAERRARLYQNLFAHNENPARLLDLDAFDDGLDIRLIETDGMLATKKYACLSHCWGDNRHIKTETTNIQRWKKCIPWKLLPKTFRDALHFVRKLKLKYLWIDSLCIIQDDRQDWKRESARMATIYRNAFITIAATSSSSDSGGCYSSGEPLDKDYEVGTDLFVREKPVHFECPQPPDISSPFPLLSRGWVYQERVLSRRVLHFGPKELLWECDEFCGCQCQRLDPQTSFKQLYERSLVQETVPGGSGELPPCFPSGPHECVSDPDRLIGEILSNYAPFALQTSGITDELLDLSRTSEDQQGSICGKTACRGRHYDSTTSLWHKLVSEYSALRLTVLEDRVPAILGLARDFVDRAHLTGSSCGGYGLWERSFVHDLLWHVDEPLCGRSERRTFDPYQGIAPPSWSWTSVNGKVSYWDEHFRDRDFDILRMPNLGHWEIGRLVAPLKVWGRLTPATLNYTYTASGEVDPMHYELCYSGRHSYMNVDKDVQFRTSDAGRRVPLFADYCLYSVGMGYIKNEGTLYCLGNFIGESFTASLVLQRLLESGTVVYRRIGIVSIPHVGRKGEKGFFYAAGVADTSIKPSVVMLV
ncbi:hypothetical protein VMCG_06100 [Cytospora schulzeri]|uniref:Heterokaryon incompatibility domain-containing protein n=1 Tax=Cytospora schulzeri TaxID=448051 RepID=A0A423WGF9_9PEZI|nr:hypothetical protein VMCG_06100 [Valsa malicola]